jgi:hypothetical protein
VNVLTHYPIVTAILLAGLAFFCVGLLLLITRSTRRVGRALCCLAPVVTGIALWGRFLWFASDRYFWSLILQITAYCIVAGVAFTIVAWPLYYCARRWPKLDFLVSVEFWGSVIGFVLVSWLFAFAVRDFWLMWRGGDKFALLYILVILIWPATWVWFGIKWLRKSLKRRNFLAPKKV